MTAPTKVHTGYRDREKIHLAVAVNKTDELNKFKWLAGVTIGPLIAESAPVLAQHTFTDVVVVTNGAVQPTPVDAILTPIITHANETRGANNSGESIVSLKVEWTLKDPNGDTFWVETFTGEGRGAAGSAYRANLLEDAYKQVMSKSQEGMWFSRAIREYAAKKYPDVAIKVQNTTEQTTEQIADQQIARLCDNLSSSSPDTVDVALKLLRKTNAPEAVPKILPCLTHHNPNVVRDACRTLAVLGNADVIPAIEPLLQNRRKDIREDARIAIARLSRTTEQSRDSLKSAEPAEVIQALQHLQRKKATEAIPDILPLLRSSNGPVLCQACQTLAAIGNKDIIPNIEPLVNIPESAVDRNSSALFRMISIKAALTHSPFERVRKEAQDAIDKLNAK